jgi:F-type H+-transporting ATPase subunit b
MIRQAESEAQRLIKENRELAEKTRQEIIEQAKQSAQNLVEKSKQEIEREKDSALLSLRSEIADLAIEATRKILEESLDEKRQRTLVDSFLDKIPKFISH